MHLLPTAVLSAALITAASGGTGDRSDAGPLTPGTITVEQSGGGAGDAPATRAGDQPFAEAVQRAILQTSFMPLPAPSHSRYVALVSVSRQARGVVTSGAKASPPATNVGNWGAGVKFSLPTSNNALHGLVVTQLTVTVVQRGDPHPLWTGSATTAQVEDTPAGTLSAVANKLASALFAHFPSRMDAPLSIP
jgi:hypothetical protein